MDVNNNAFCLFKASLSQNVVYVKYVSIAEIEIFSIAIAPTAFAEPLIGIGSNL